ncbi:MAG: DUF4178 domain-containing protein [Deltaproteobacteria bacterium]|nr:DUF4178 domain-containing protein [Deltaproteobacteria bacterium]
MSRLLRCPNCGGEHQLANPGITMIVCHYCQTTVYWGEDAVLKTGGQSILPESDARLYLHATGKLSGTGYQVIGHLHYAHDRGSWDEWYLQLDDGRVAWVSEDERKLTLEMAQQVQQAPAVSQLVVGAGALIADTQFTVRELGVAECRGGEGQLPFAILPGERYTYADIASLDGQHFATLEYDENRSVPTCYVGRTLSHSELTIDDEKPPSTAAGHQGQHIECSNCKGPLEIPHDREVQTQVCEYCGAQLDLTSAERKVLGVNPSDFEAGFNFEIGEAANFYGARYEVCGRMVYTDGEGYRSREYLLFEKNSGYLWLAEENGHYVLNRPTQQAPSVSPFRLAPKTSVSAAGKRFRVYESGTSELIYVDGALPWLARVGDSFYYADLIAPPQMFCAESDGDEIEYFHGRYMPAPEVWTAFGKSDLAPRPWGVHGAQPFQRSGIAKLLMAVGALFAVINLGFVFWSAGKSGHVVYQQTFPPSRYLNETVSAPFEVKGGNVMAMRISAPLSNSWIALDAAVVDDKDRVIMEVDGGEISYYSGYSGGEHWSEGRTRSTNYFKAPQPGNYRLIIKASAGHGDFNGGPRGEPLSIRITQGAVLSRYFVTAFVICALFPVFEWLRRRLFEKRRWAAVLDDDDDDDDDDQPSYTAISRPSSPSVPGSWGSSGGGSDWTKGS